MNIREIGTEVAILVGGIISAYAIYINLAPEKKETIDYATEISDMQIMVSQLEGTEELPPLKDSWLKTQLIASFFNVRIENDGKEALNGSVGSNQPAFFGRLSGDSRMAVLSAAWLIESTLPAIIQNANLTTSSTTVSIAVLGRK